MNRFKEHKKLKKKKRKKKLISTKPFTLDTQSYPLKRFNNQSDSKGLK